MPTFQASGMGHALALALSTLTTLATTAAQAQQPPTIGDALRQVQPLLLPETKPTALPPLGGVPAEPPMQVLPGGGTTVRVMAWAVVGNQVIDTPSLLALLQADVGKALTLAQLEDTAARITRVYRSRGYFVARAYVPAQEVASGTVTLRVVEGRYSRFILRNTSRVQDAVVQGLLDDIKDRDAVSLDTLERAMLIVNDTPGVRVVRADVMPGALVGTSDFAIATEATPAANGYLLLDNHGSAYTGKQRLSFNGDWNSPSGRGDRLSLGGMVTRGSGLLNGRLAYSALVASHGTRAEAALSRTRYALGNSYQALGATGTANGLDISLSTPLQRTRAQTVEAGVNLAWRDLNDEVATTATTTRKQAVLLGASVSLRREHRLFGLDGLTQASAAITAGRLSFKDAPAAVLDAAGANTQGHYAKINLSLARATALPAQWSLLTNAKLQHVLGNKNMDGSERMSVSGPGAVTAYPAGELSGDNAALLRVELSRPVPTPAFGSAPVNLSASAFANHGWAKAANPVVGGAGRELGDVGLGLMADAAGGLLRLQVAHRVTGGAPTSEPVSRTRWLLQGGWVF